MNKMIFKKLYIFSSVEKKAKVIHFSAGKNIITSSPIDGTDKGKSIIMKSLYHALGADCFFDALWNDNDKTYIVKFAIEGQEYHIYRCNKLFKVFDQDLNLLFKVIERRELATRLKDLFNFAVQLPARDEEKLEITPPAYNYVLYFLDQDKLACSNFASFNNLAQYPDYKENVLYYHFGIFDEEYRYASFKEYDISKVAELDKYSDKEQISEYAVKSIQWANANGIISGMSEEIIAPKENVQRCQVAAILKRFCKNYQLFDEKLVEKTEDTNDKKAENKDTSSVGSGEIIGAGGGPDDPIVPPEDIPDINTETQRPTLKVNTTYGNPGDSIKVVIDVQNNPGILGMILQLEYDEDAMLLVNAENGEAIADVLTLTTSKDLKSGSRFVWDGLEINPGQIKNGSVLNLEFKISESATPGKRYPLSLEFNSRDIVDSNLESINPKIIQGFIEIEQEK